MKTAYFLTFFASLSLWATPEVWLVAEHHHSSKYREAFNQILQSQPQMDCVFLEDSPEMDEAAQAFLSGKGSFQETYLARFYEVNRRMNYKDDEIKKNLGFKLRRPRSNSPDCKRSTAKSLPRGLQLTRKCRNGKSLGKFNY